MIVVYTRDSCPYCVAAKRLLDSLGIEYETRHLSISPESIERLVAETGGMTFPQILVDDQVIGGFDQLNALHKRGELLPMLNR